MARKPTVLFVCVHNAGRLHMAAGWLTHLSGGQVEVRSAGSEPVGQVNPVAVQAMREAGIDITAESPNILTRDAVQNSDVVITMGCGDTCPVFPAARVLDRHHLGHGPRGRSVLAAPRLVAIRPGVTLSNEPTQGPGGMRGYSARPRRQPLDLRHRTAGPVGAENCVTSCDLGIFADQAAEPVPAQYPDAGARSRWIHAPSSGAFSTGTADVESLAHNVNLRSPRRNGHYERRISSRMPPAARAEPELEFQRTLRGPTHAWPPGRRSGLVWLAVRRVPK